MKNTSIHAHHISIHQTNTKCKLRKLIALRMSKPHLIHFRQTNTRCQSRKLFIYESSTGLHIMYRLAHVYEDRMWSFQPIQINPKNYLLLCIYIWYTSTQEHQGQCNHCTNSYKLMQMTHEKLQWTNCRALSTRIIYQPKCIKNKAITLTEWWDEFWHYYETFAYMQENSSFSIFPFPVLPAKPFMAYCNCTISTRAHVKSNTLLLYSKTLKCLYLFEARLPLLQ